MSMSHSARRAYVLHVYYQTKMHTQHKKLCIYSKYLSYRLSDRHPHAHPGHQPELDSKAAKKIYNSWETTSRVAYVDPRIRLQPLNSAECTKE